MMTSPCGRFLSLLLLSACRALLFPHDSTTRESKSLDGVWNFRASPLEDPDLGFRDSWFSGPLTDTLAMPVPSSYNDITVDSGLRDFVGWAWYDRTFYVSPAWRDQRVILR